MSGKRERVLSGKILFSRENRLMDLIAYKKIKEKKLAQWRKDGEEEEAVVKTTNTNCRKEKWWKIKEKEFKAS